jgi:hypothetical protein
MNWKLFIYNLTAGNVIPVIGNNLSLLKGENGTPVPLYDFIAGRLMEIEDDIPYTRQSIGEIVLAHPEIAPTIKSIYKQISEESFYTGPLEKLAEITDFNFFISTTVDDLLVKAIRKVRHYDDSEINVINYSLQGKSPTNVEPKVTVFNLLGTLDDLKHSAIDEEEMLEYFFSIAWRECDNHPQAEYFIRHVRDKTLLFIGCDFPDWLMRFVIRILSNRRIKDETFKDHIVISTKKESGKLKNFLAQCEKDVVIINEEQANNAEIFIHLLYNKWRDKKKEDKCTQYEGTVFLSYYHKDEKDAEALKNALETERINVWFDKEDLRAGEHEDRIWEAIDKCKIFIPVISGKCLDAAESYAREYEWAKANLIYNYKKKSDQPLAVIPCSIGEVDRKDERIPGFMRDSTIFDLKTGQDRIVDEVKNLLKPKL